MSCCECNDTLIARILNLVLFCSAASRNKTFFSTRSTVS
jgi:hypothetical protein